MVILVVGCLYNSVKRINKYAYQLHANYFCLCLCVGERTKSCTVQLMNDNLFEPDEAFRLVLGSPRTISGIPAVVGDQNVTLITVHDVGDGE